MGMTSIFGFFINPVAVEFSLNVATVTLAPVLFLLVPALVAPLIGRLADALPAKRLMLVGVLVMSSALYGISLVSSPQAALLGFFFFVLGLTLCGPAVINAFLIKLYQLHSGRALAIAAMGLSLATVILPIAVADLLRRGSWQSALAEMAVILSLLLLPLIIFGLPASNRPLSGVDLQPNSPSEEGLASGFFRRLEFWLIGLGAAAILNVALVMGICYPPHLQNIGLDLSAVATVMAVGGIGGFFGKFLAAAKIDQLRAQIKYIAMAVPLLKVAGLLLLLHSDGFYGIVLAAFFIGMGSGGFIPLHAVLNACYFDSAVAGRVNGAQMPLFLPLGLIGPPLAGYIYDSSGSYAPMLWVLCAVLLVGVLLLALLPRSSVAAVHPIQAEVATRSG